jgi:hypothetical protein
MRVHSVEVRGCAHGPALTLSLLLISLAAMMMYRLAQQYADASLSRANSPLQAQQRSGKKIK